MIEDRIFLDRGLFGIVEIRETETSRITAALVDGTATGPASRRISRSALRSEMAGRYLVISERRLQSATSSQIHFRTY